MLDLSILNQAPPTYTGPAYPDLNVIVGQVSDQEIWDWMHQHSVWINGKFLFRGLRNQVCSADELQFALSNPTFRNEARQAIAKQRYEDILKEYNQLQPHYQEELVQFYIRRGEALQELIKEREDERGDAIKQLRAEIANKDDQIMRLKERDDKALSDRDIAIEQLRDEIAKRDKEIKRLSIEVSYYKLDPKKPEEQKQVDAQLNPNVNDLLLKAAKMNDYDAAKDALDHGADKNTCAKAFQLTKEPRIKIMLFAVCERMQGVDNQPQTTTVQPDKTFDPEKDKYLVSHWPLKGTAIDEKHLNTGKLHDADVVADRFNNPESSCHFGGKEFIIGDAKHFPKGNRAISLWFKADRNTDGKIQGGTLFSYCGEDVSNNLAIIVNHDLDYAPERSGNLCVYDFGKPGKSIKYAANSEVHFDNWNHLVLTSDIGEGTDIYLNGKCVAHRNICFNSENLEKSIQSFSIGALVYDAQAVGIHIDPMFKGSINDVMLYSRGLSAEEISALYQAQSPNPISSVNAEKGEQKRVLTQSSSTLFPNRTDQYDLQSQDNTVSVKEEQASKFAVR